MRLFTLIPPLLFLGGFACYVFLLPGGVGWLDSGELLAGAHHLGVSHPPGQPLYALVGKAALLLPVGGLGFRGALLSALAGAAAWPILYGLALGLARAVTKGARDPWAPLLAAAAAVSFGLLGPAAFEATRAEVYMLAAALLLAVLGLLVRWGEDGDARRLFQAALLLGLVTALHPLLGVALLAVALVFALTRDAPAFGRACGAAAVAFALGFAVYLLLPLRAGRSDLAWGDPGSAARFLATASGAPYAGNFGAGEPLWDRLAGHATLFYRQMGWQLLLLAGIGLFVLLRRSWRTFLLVGGAALAALGSSLAQAVFNGDNPDVSGALLLAHAILLLGAVLPVGFEGQRLPPRAEAAVAVLGAAAVVFFSPIDLRAQDEHPEAFAREALRPLPARALLVAESDHAEFPLLFAQRVEGERPDVATAIAPLLESSWYLRALKRWTPDLFVPWLDDGLVGALAERLVAVNARTRAVFAELPRRGGVDLGLVAQLAGEPIAAADGLAAWEAGIGEEATELTRRVRGHARWRRVRRQAREGRIGEAAALAAQTLGLDAPWLPLWEALAREGLLGIAGAPSFRPAGPAVPRSRPGFIFDESLAEWRAGDLLWALGLPGLAAPWMIEGPEAAIARALHLARAGEDEQAARAVAGVPDGRLAVARALVSDRIFARALAWLQPLVAAGDAGALALAGACEGERGDLGAAERLLRASLERRPGSTAALTDLGLVLAKQSRFAEAEAVWREAARQREGGRARRFLAKLRRERGAP